MPKGKVELWDPWTGKARPLDAMEGFRRIHGRRCRWKACEAQLIVFNPGEPNLAVETGTWTSMTDAAVEDHEGLLLKGYCSTAGCNTALRATFRSSRCNLWAKRSPPVTAGSCRWPHGNSNLKSDDGQPVSAITKLPSHSNIHWGRKGAGSAMSMKAMRAPALSASVSFVSPLALVVLVAAYGGGLNSKLIGAASGFVRVSSQAMRSTAAREHRGREG